jgi:hypothetical protein
MKNDIHVARRRLRVGFWRNLSRDFVEDFPENPIAAHEPSSVRGDSESVGTGAHGKNPEKPPSEPPRALERHPTMLTIAGMSDAVGTNERTNERTNEAESATSVQAEDHHRREIQDRGTAGPQ